MTTRSHVIARRVIASAAVVVAATGLVAAILAPPDRLQGNLQKLMYVHVPTAWLAYAAFLLTLVGSVGWLWRRRQAYDRLAAAAAEVGVFFTGLTLVLGSIWGKPVWGVWWTWDARLVTTALLFFIYVGYLALRRAIPERADRARRSAVFGILAFAMVPIVHFSVLWWRTLHQPPTVLRPGDPTIDHTMLLVLGINLLGFTLVGLWLLMQRIETAADQEALEDGTVARDRELAGASIEPPHLKGPRDSA
ncbi:MAG: cytochrome c biogenesis protein CcsA [Candidatus Nanopelagicales bacterium]